MGRIYLAYDSLLERDVALKELSVPDYLNEEEKAEIRERFRQEAKAAARLTHPHILTVHDIIVSGDRQYIVMEYLEGKTMREVLSERRLSSGEVMSIAPMVCDALGYAHRQGIIHRDVKPDNIFVLRNGNIKVADFGIAKMIRVSDRTHTDVIMGTPNYIAPEVIQGKPYDHRVDIFALGVTIYEMLSGRRPFDAENDFAVIYRVVTEEPLPLSELVEDAPPSLVRAVHKALRKDPSLRHRDMEEFKADLMEVRSELGMESRGEEPFDKETAFMSELEAARSVVLEEEAAGRFYDFRRDREWKELISRIYADQPRGEEVPAWQGEEGMKAPSETRAPAGRTESRTGPPAYGEPAVRKAGWAAGAAGPLPGAAARPGAPEVASTRSGARVSRRDAPAGRTALSGAARRLAAAIPALSAVLLVSTLLPWIGKGLNPARSLMGISFPEGMLVSGLATLVAGCDALLLLGVLPPGRWTRAMRGMSLVSFLAMLLFLGLRVLAGLGYRRAAGLSPLQSLSGAGWGLWVAGTSALALYILCSRLEAESP